MRLWGGIILFLALLANPAAAHTRSESYSSWTVEGHEAAGVFRVDARRATQLIEDERHSELGPLLAKHLVDTVTMAQDGTACAASPPRPLAAEPGQLRVELRFRCVRDLVADPATLTVTAFRAVSPTHVHYAVVTAPDGSRQESLLSAGRATMTLGSVADRPGDFGGYVWLGLTHVLSGVDHLAFLLALALLAGQPLRAALAATGFTLGHSVTLGLTAAGRLHPDSGAVEALIGFTVAYAAWEALAGRQPGGSRGLLIAAVLIVALPFIASAFGRPTPPWPVYAGVALFAVCMSRLGARGWTPVVLAAGFGLVHGAGFAGALIELDIGRDRLLPALLGFNVGVELAQLAALGVMWVAALGVARLPGPVRERAFAFTTAALALVGTYWFVSRSFV